MPARPLRPADVDPLEDDVRRAYWFRTRRPFACLLFLAPLLVAQAVGALWLGAIAGEGDAAVSPVVWAVPAAVGFVLFMWNAYGYADWRCRADTLGGMFSESVLFAWGLVAVGLLLGAEVGAHALVDETTRFAAVTAVVEAVGRAITAETAFRLILLPLAFSILTAAGTSKRWATPVAFLASGLCSAVASLVGPAGETVAVTEFAFAAIAGCLFAWLFWCRGFGVAVGTHAAFVLISAVVNA